MTTSLGHGRNAGWLRSLALLGIVLSGLAVTACASKTDQDPLTADRPPEVIYDDAMGLMEERKFESAAKTFEEVERQHPYSQLATQSQIMAAYALYEGLKYDDAVTAAQRYIDLHPGAKDVVYAYYLIGMSYYEQISDVGRDQGMTEEALKALTEVIRRFPESDYARDAQLKVDLVQDHLAGKEMEIGRYYLRRQQYVAAINRFRTVVEKYQTTSQVPEALERLTEAYLAVGVVREAQNAAAVLGYNYPGSVWYERSYALLSDQSLSPEKDEGSWLSKIF